MFKAAAEYAIVAAMFAAIIYIVALGAHLVPP